MGTSRLAHSVNAIRLREPWRKLAGEFRHVRGTVSRDSCVHSPRLLLSRGRGTMSHRDGLRALFADKLYSGGETRLKIAEEASDVGKARVNPLDQFSFETSLPEYSRTHKSPRVLCTTIKKKRASARRGKIGLSPRRSGFRRADRA